MAKTRWKTVALGIRARKHPTRRHGAGLDRYFTLRFSVDGHQVEEALGWASHGWTIKRAQEELGKLREAKRTGQGPKTLRERAAAQRKAQQQQVEEELARARREKTVAELWDRYCMDVVAVGNKASTAAEKNRVWKRRIEPAIGEMKVNDVTDDDAGKMVRSALRLDETGLVVAGKAEAGNVYRLLHHLFKKALLWKWRHRELGNPLAAVDEPRVARRERLLTATEIAALLKGLDQAVKEPPQVVAVIRAAIFTGARISELLALRHEDVRRDEMELHLADTKTGFSRRPMATATLEVIDSVKPMPGVPFVFRAVKNPRVPLPYRTTEKGFKRIAAAAGVPNCTLHTLRHWVATMTANTTSNARVGMAITGHRSHAAYMGYVHSNKVQAQVLAEQLAELAKNLARAEPSMTTLPKRSTL